MSGRRLVHWLDSGTRRQNVRVHRRRYGQGLWRRVWRRLPYEWRVARAELRRSLSVAFSANFGVAHDLCLSHVETSTSDVYAPLRRSMLASSRDRAFDVLVCSVSY